MSEKGKVIQPKERKIIYNVLSFFENEAHSGKLSIPIQQAQKRTIAATGVSRSTVARIKKENLISSDVTPPGKRKKPQKNRNILLNVEELDLCVIRRTLNEFYACQSIPSLKTLLLAVQTKINFPWKRENLRRLLHKLGYQYKRCQDRGTIAVENPYIVRWRYRYLREIKKYRNNNRIIIFLDETRVDSYIGFGKHWQIESNKALIKRNEEDTLIMIHAVSKDGFVPGTTSFQSNTAESYYHKQMNFDIFLKWVQEKLLPNIPLHCVICMKSAPYHFKMLNPRTSDFVSREELLKWLRENQIPHDLKMRKTELYDLVAANSPPEKKYWIGEFMKEKGYDVLKIPPYHADLNPIEFSWADAKSYVRERTFSAPLSFETMKHCIANAFSSISNEQWKKYYERVLEYEDSYWELDYLVEENIEQLSFVLGSESFDESDASESAESDFECDSETNLNEDEVPERKIEFVITPD